MINKDILNVMLDLKMIISIIKNIFLGDGTTEASLSWNRYIK